MSAPFDFPPGESDPTQAGSGLAPGRRAAPTGGRHALGLPAGSIRALLAFMVLGLIWALMYLEKGIPLYLQYLMFLILGHYFAARRQPAAPVDVREPAPLWMPRGVIRVMILLGFLGLIGGLYYHHRENVGQWMDNMKNAVLAPDRDKGLEDPSKEGPYMPLLLVGGFFMGLVVGKFGQLIGGKEGQPGWYQDIQAWIALLAMIGLGVEIIIKLVINPSLENQSKDIITLPEMEAILSAIIGFYFGARS